MIKVTFEHSHSGTELICEMTNTRSNLPQSSGARIYAIHENRALKMLLLMCSDSSLKDIVSH